MLVHGYMDRQPDERRIPSACTAAIIDPKTQMIRLPLDDVITAEHFDELVERGEATRVTHEPVRVDCCLFFPEGTGPPEYLTFAAAAARFKVFADEQIRLGDERFNDGLTINALHYYELAAAAAQRPEDYKKMLLCPMPERRRKRIEKMLADVTRASGVTRH